MPDPQNPAPEPEQKSTWQSLLERFFPPSTLAGKISDSIKKTTPPQGRRRPPSGPPIDKMDTPKKPKTVARNDDDSDSDYA